MPTKQEAFVEIQPSRLATVSGGTTQSDQQLQLMLSQITTSIQNLNSNKNQTDPTMMIMMMMLMGGGGGGGGVYEGGCRGGRKGW
jgi:hypothetical protein